MKSRVAQRRAGGGGPPRQAYYALCGRGARALALLAVLAAALSPLAAVAQPTTPKAPAPADAPPPPPPAPSATPPAVEPETGLEPEVTITTRGEVTYEEYRLHGKLYMVKVTPKRGKPYYLIDHEGGGEFRRSDIEPRISVPNWVIKSW